jgi:hypothetical protein
VANYFCFTCTCSVMIFIGDDGFDQCPENTTEILKKDFSFYDNLKNPADFLRSLKNADEVGTIESQIHAMKLAGYEPVETPVKQKYDTVPKGRGVQLKPKDYDDGEVSFLDPISGPISVDIVPAKNTGDTRHAIFHSADVDNTNTGNPLVHTVDNTGDEVIIVRDNGDTEPPEKKPKLRLRTRKKLLEEGQAMRI